MILTCPNCSTRYVLSSAAIGPEGREVRCAKCSHEWFEEGHKEEVFEDNSPLLDNLQALGAGAAYENDDEPSVSSNWDDESEEYDDTEEKDEEHFLEKPAPPVVRPPVDHDDSIPEAVKPNHNDANNVPAFAEQVRRRKPSLQARITGFATALLIFLCLIAAFLFSKPAILDLWPPAAAIYELAGLPVEMKGENLVMEQLSASIIKDREGKEILVLKGRVINLTSEAVDVPQMRAMLRSTNGENGESWIIDAPVDRIGAGASFAFTSDYPSVPRGVGSVNLTFVPTIAGTANIQRSELVK